MLPLTLPDTRTRLLPTHWGEVTLGQSAQLADLPEGADTYSLLAILLGLIPVEVMNLSADFVHEQVLPALEFATTGELPDLASAERPTELHLCPADCGLYRALPVPADLTAATFGQACDLGDVLRDAAMPVHQKRLQVLAILFYPAYYAAPYDSDGVAAFAADVCASATLEEALPLTDFFLLPSTASAAPTWPNSSPSRPAPTRRRRGWSSWWRSGMRWLWSMRWRRATRPAGPTSGA